MLTQLICPARRTTSRIETPDGVWAIWRCNDREMISAVRNVSPGGLFVELATFRAVGARAEVYFLVPEGGIRAEAIVRHVRLGSGLGLKITEIPDADRAHMASLIRRLRNFSRGEEVADRELISAEDPRSPPGQSFVNLDLPLDAESEGGCRTERRLGHASQDLG
jgi:hypothetical protein